jgi:hypothetical protein
MPTRHDNRELVQNRLAYSKDTSLERLRNASTTPN